MSIVLFQKTNENQIGHLELNLPEKRNILSLQMIQSLTTHFETLSQDPDIRLLILSGKGDHFCAGGDLRWMSPGPDISDLENISQVKLLSKMFYSLFQLPFLVIGKIKGSVFGGGLGLTAICDIAVAHNKAQFCFSELKLALVPALITPFILKKISAGKARELMLSTRIFKADEALNLGLIHFTGNNTECDNYVDKLSRQVMSFDKTALKQTKKLLNVFPELSDSEAREYTVQALAERRKSPEVSQRIKKFLALRKTKNKHSTEKK